MTKQTTPPEADTDSEAMTGRPQAKDELFRLLAKERRRLEREAEDLMLNLRQKRTLLYPDAGLDWQPLYRLSHLCDVFIYIDEAMDQSDVAKEIGVIPKLPKVGATFSSPKIVKLNSEFLGKFDLVAEKIHFFQEPWGVAANLTRTVGNVTRPLTLIYLFSPPEHVYQQLFTMQQTAPRIVCVTAGYDETGTSLSAWNGALGQAVAANSVEPQLVIKAGQNGVDWPWTKLWQEFPGWYGSQMFARPGATAVHGGLLGRSGEKTVVISRNPLTPENIADAQAILVNPHMLRQFAWPGSVKVIVDAPADFEPDEFIKQLNPHFGQFTPIQVEGLAMGEALKRIDNLCHLGNIERLACIKVGFEDEGPELGVWCSKSGMLKKLTLHCPLEGDLESFGTDSG